MSLLEVSAILEYLSYERHHQGHLQQEDSYKFHLIKHHSQSSMNDIF